MAPVFYGKLAFVTFFNAGVRAIDVRNPYAPKEAGYFIPAITEATDKRCIKVDGQDRCKIAIQSNNVETDDRGYIYVVDRANTGLHILEVTGEARAIAGIKVFFFSPRPAKRGEGGEQQSCEPGEGLTRQRIPSPAFASLRHPLPQAGEGKERVTPPQPQTHPDRS